MKIMIISDIHGNLEKLNTIINIFKQEKCDKLLILGDLFNYGIDYYKDDIIEQLNNMKDCIIAVRGNCDYDINDLNFNMPYINYFIFNNKKIVMTHGHLYTIEELIKQDYDIVLVGHSHISKIEKINNKFVINPGSISKSRRGDNSFAIIDNNLITIRNLNNEVINKLDI